MAKGIYKNRERTERRISAATSILLCALTVLAQIAVTLLLTHLLKEKASFVYGVLQFIGAVVAIRVYLRTGSPSYKLSWMCLLLALPVSGMILFCVWGGTHQAKQLSLKPVPPIPQRESQRMLSDMNQAAAAALHGGGCRPIFKNGNSGCTGIPPPRISVTEKRFSGT